MSIKRAAGLLAVSICLLAPRALVAEDPDADGRRSGPVVDKPLWHIVKTGEYPPHYQVTIEIPPVTITPGKDGVAVTFAGQSGRLSPGQPDLPSCVRLFPGIPGYALSFDLVDADVAVVTQGVTVAAVPTRLMQGSVPTHFELQSIRAPDPEIYALETYWPDDLLRVYEAWQGTRKLARVEIVPVRYNPSTGAIAVASRLNVVLRYERNEKKETDRGPR